MAYSDVDICNMALDEIGTDSILSIDEDSKPAKLCKRWYSLCRKTLLKDLNASFAIKRAVLSEKGEFKPVYGYTNAFVLPHDCLNVLNIEDPMFNEVYQIEANKLLYCNYNGTVHIRYIFDNKDVSSYDDHFKELFALKLAEKICMRLTMDVEKKNYLIGLIKAKYIEASYKYANDNKIQVINKPYFRNSKIGVYKEVIR